MKILITGATGHVGSTLIRLLANEGKDLKAATRYPEEYNSSNSLKQIKATHFDYEEPETWAPALTGVNKIYLIVPPGATHRDEQINPFIKKAINSEVEHIVLQSTASVDFIPNTMLGRIEEALKKSGLAYTILRPGWYMQNFSDGAFSKPIIEQGILAVPADEAPVAFIDTSDVAAVAAKIFVDGNHKGETLTLTGPEAITHNRVAELIGIAGGRTINYQSISEAEFRKAVSAAGLQDDYINILLRLFGIMRSGKAAKISPVVKQILKRPPISFEQFVKREATKWQ